MFAKTLLAAGTTIALIAATAVGVGAWQYRSAAHLVATRAFASAQGAARVVRDQQLRRLERLSARVVDADFAARLAHALAADDAIGQRLDAASIRLLLEQRRGQDGIDAMAVIDADGKYVTAVGEPFLAQHDLESLPVTLTARREHRQASAVLDDDARVPLVAVTPVMAAGNLAALLVTATHRDADALRKIADVAGVALALVAIEPTGPSVVDATLDARAAGQVQATVDRIRARLAGKASGELAVNIDGRQWPARYWPVQAAAKKAFLVALLPPAPLDAIGSALAPALIVATLTGLVLVCLVLLVVWRGGLAPLAEMDRISERARRGDFALELKPRGFAIVRRLGDLLNLLMRELDRHRVPHGAPRRRTTDSR